MGPDYSSYPTPGSVDASALGGGMFAFMAGMMMLIVVFLIIFYVWMAICLMKIAHKTNTPNAWFAWIPILNVVLMLQIAKKPVWWVALLILFIIPFINFIAGIVWLVLTIIIWMAICKQLGKQEWLGVLMIIPVVNLVIPGYLAFSNSATAPVNA